MLNECMDRAVPRDGPVDGILSQGGAEQVKGVYISARVLSQALSFSFLTLHQNDRRHISPTNPSVEQ